MPEYYDYVLGFVPLALVGLTGVLRVAGVDPLIAIPVGATAAAVAVGHALFVNGPGAVGVDESTARSPSSTERLGVDAD